MLLLDILPGVGIGPARLGMRAAEVAALFDEPQDRGFWADDESLNDWADDTYLDGYYLFHGFRLGFDKDDARGPLPDGRLTLIVVVRPRPHVRLYGRPLGEWTPDELYARLHAD